MKARLAPIKSPPVSSEIDIRPMAWRDLGEVVGIEEAVFTAPWPRSVFQHELRYNRHSVMMVVHLADRSEYPGVVGYAGFWAVSGEMHVTTLAVHPSFQRRGVARRLMERCFEEARQRGCTQATLEVRESNEAAQSLYASYGFVVAGRRPRYYKGGEDALIMTLERL